MHYIGTVISDQCCAKWNFRLRLRLLPPLIFGSGSEPLRFSAPAPAPSPSDFRLRLRLRAPPIFGSGSGSGSDLLQFSAPAPTPAPEPAPGSGSGLKRAIFYHDDQSGLSDQVGQAG